jgi:hypothetical protein
MFGIRLLDEPEATAAAFGATYTPGTYQSTRELPSPTGLLVPAPYDPSAPLAPAPLLDAIQPEDYPVGATPTDPKAIARRMRAYEDAVAALPNPPAGIVRELCQRRHVDELREHMKARYGLPCALDRAWFPWDCDGATLDAEVEAEELARATAAAAEARRQQEAQRRNEKSLTELGLGCFRAPFGELAAPWPSLMGAQDKMPTPSWSAGRWSYFLFSSAGWAGLEIPVGVHGRLEVLPGDFVPDCLASEVRPVGLTAAARNYLLALRDVDRTAMPPEGPWYTLADPVGAAHAEEAVARIRAMGVTLGSPSGDDHSLVAELLIRGFRYRPDAAQTVYERAFGEQWKEIFPDVTRHTPARQIWVDSRGNEVGESTWEEALMGAPGPAPKSNIATGDGGSLFQRDHRTPGTRPLARGRRWAPPPSLWIA